MSDVGITVIFNTNDWQNHHREQSKLILRLFWTNLDALFKGEKVREIKAESFTLSITGFRRLGWLTLPILPFILVHESLHFIVGYFTGNRHLTVLVPPFLDLLYLPISVMFVAITRPVNDYLIFIMFWVEWAWIVHLMENLSGDFAPYLRKIKREREQPDASKQDVTAPVFGSRERIVTSEGPCPD